MKILCEVVVLFFLFFSSVITSQVSAICGSQGCEDGYKCVTIRGEQRCVAIRSCKLLKCGPDEACLPIASWKGDSSKAPLTCRTRNCACPKIFSPVCGADAKTYSNECLASCKGIEILYEGECEDVCACTKEYNPVCGDNGVVFPNPCTAKCEGASYGPCPSPSCDCDEKYEPVCGKDGITYSNKCAATCMGADIVSEGTCHLLERKCGCAPWNPLCCRLRDEKGVEDQKEL